MSYQYTIRSFAPPIGWTIPVLSSDVITNDLLNQLYPFWSCSVSQIATPYIQNLKKGIVNEYPNSVQFLEDGLWVLCDWYNGGYSFTLPPDIGDGMTLSIYYANSDTDNSMTQPLAINLSADNVSDLIVDLNLALPSGWVATISGLNVYIQSVGALQQYIYVIASNNSVTTTTWSFIDFWSCIPYSVVQNLVENLNKAAGCPNCQNTTLIETDNTYTSLSLPTPLAVSPTITTYSNTFYE